MAYRYFRGKVDLERLSLTDLSRATEALATLERLAAEGRLGFEMGVARTRREGKQAGRTIQPQERAMLEAMPPGEWVSSREIAAAMPTLPANSLTARLAMMASYGWVEVSRRVNEDRPAGTPGRRSVKIYRRADVDPASAPVADLAPVQAPGDLLAEGADDGVRGRHIGSGSADPREAGEPRKGRRAPRLG